MTNTLDELERAVKALTDMRDAARDGTPATDPNEWEFDELTRILAVFHFLLSDRDELLATVRRQGDLLEFMAAYIGTPAKERETQWPTWSATERKKEAVADYWAELASAAIIQTERERDKQLDQK